MASKYDLIAADLREKIQRGDFQPGEQMPAETSLMEQYDVSLATMRKALDQLGAEGAIEKRQGIGTFVRAPRARVRRTTDRYQWEKDRALLPESERRETGATEHDTGLKVEDLVFNADYSTIEADRDLAAAFDVPVGTQLLRRVYRTRPGGEDSPFGLSQSYLIYDMVSGNPELLKVENEPWPGGTHHQLSTVGIEVDKIIDEISARPPSPEEAAILVIDAGVSVITLRKTSVDTTGAVVEVADVLMPGDRTQLVYTTQLARRPHKRRKAASK
jgi:GntR family transcriptional regulator